MVDTQIIEIENRGRSGSACVSTNIPKRPSAFFIILNLLVRVLCSKSPILIEQSRLADVNRYVKHKLPILTKLCKVTKIKAE